MELNFPRVPKPIQNRPLWKSVVFGFSLIILAVCAFFIFSHPDVGCKLINRPFVRYGIPGYDENDEFGGCLVYYPDGGKACTSDNDCKGKCDDGYCTHNSLQGSSFRPQMREKIIFP